MYQHLKNSKAAANQGGTTRTVENGESWMSRGNFFRKAPFALLALGVIFCGCKSDGGGNDGPGDDNGLRAGQIQFKAEPESDNSISFYATAEKITIDWGDGQIDELTLHGAEKELTHEYLNQNYQTVSIVAESITVFRKCYQSSNRGTLLELRFGKCPELKKIDCSNQKLTVLDIKNSVASLEELNCCCNSLNLLDVSGASKLRELTYNGNLEELNVKGCTALTSLNCSANKITQLDLSSCTALEMLECQDNELTRLDLTKKHGINLVVLLW